MGLGGKINIHNRIEGTTHEFGMENIMQGIRLYIGGGGSDFLSTMDANDADAVVHLGIWGEVRYPL